MTELIPCVGYFRFSSEGQQETSIEYQREGAEAYCEKNGLKIVAEYIDRAQTATTDRRENFQKLVFDACSQPAWKIILVYDYSRLNRNMEDALHYVRVFMQSGIKVISVTEPFDNSAESKFARNMKFAMNQYYSDHNAEITHGAQKKNAEKGIHCGGIPPLGYDLDASGFLVINEAEADVVRKIFSMYLDGFSYRAMAKILNEEGYVTKAGLPFKKNSFYSILHQEKYTGMFVWNQSSSKFRNDLRVIGYSRNTHLHKPESEQVRKPGGCPVIIPKDTFDKVQERLKSRAHGRATGKSNHLYVLGGMRILKCGKCGSYMVGVMKRKRNGDKYAAYSCPNHKGGPCPTKDLPAEQLDRMILKYIVTNIIKEKHFAPLNKLLRSQTGDEALLRRKFGAEKKINNLIKALEANGSSSVADRLAALESEKRDIEQQLKQVQSKHICLTADNLKDMRKNLYKFLSTSNTPEARSFLKSVIREVKIDNDNISFTLNYPTYH